MKKTEIEVDAWIISASASGSCGCVQYHMGRIREILKSLIFIPSRWITTVYRERAEEWDDFGSYETFLRLTEGFPDLHYLHTGDELKLCGLQIKVLSAYDKEYYQQSHL